MSAPLVIHTFVLPDGRVEISSPELRPGDEVEVTVVSTKNGVCDAQTPSLIEILSRPPGPNAFKTAEEVDAYLKEERASWDD